MILILSTHEDLHAQHVMQLLEQRGVTAIWFDPVDFPQRADITINYSSTGITQLTLKTVSSEINLSSVHSVWHRRPGTPLPDDRVPGDTARRYVAQESAMVLDDLWSILDATWLPGPPATVRCANHKGLQLRIAGELGFRLPPTLITNSPDDLLEFYRAHAGGIVSKQAARAFPSTIGLGMMRFTDLVTTRDIAHYQTIKYCPMTFQQYVDKRIELRITIVGDRVFAAEIHSQTTHHTRYDWRHYDASRTPHLPHVLPPAIEQRCIDLVAKLGLRYGAIDMILTPSGEYVFLEINPNGQYLWIEEFAELPISAAICDLLIDSDKHR
jgi:glutathione synthase/RimK-type ligase-like ATP-grasp enzyme